MADPIRFSATVQGGRELQERTARFDGTLRRELPANTQTAAEATSLRIRTSLLSGSYETNAGLRAGIAAGIRVQRLPGGVRMGVQIVATPDNMPDGKAPLVLAWDKETFRHPVFRPDVIVDQAGKPYFERTIEDEKDRFTRAVTSAMTDAGSTLAGAAR